MRSGGIYVCAVGADLDLVLCGREREDNEILWPLLVFFVAWCIAAVCCINVGIRITRKRRKALAILGLVPWPIIRVMIILLVGRASRQDMDKTRKYQSRGSSNQVYR